MIDTSNINTAIIMTDEAFIEIAKQGQHGSVVSVVEVDNKGWAIYGFSGVYQSPTGERIFEDLGYVHQLIAGWGIESFVQGKVVLVMPKISLTTPSK